MKYTKTTLQKLEQIFEDLSYVIRYEKGNFQSGYCLVENRKIVVLNKFFELEARINTLLEILSQLNFEETALSEESFKFYEKVKKRETIEE